MKTTTAKKPWDSLHAAGIGPISRSICSPHDWPVVRTACASWIRPAATAPCWRRLPGLCRRSRPERLSLVGYETDPTAIGGSSIRLWPACRSTVHTLVEGDFSGRAARRGSSAGQQWLRRGDRQSALRADASSRRTAGGLAGRAVWPDGPGRFVLRLRPGDGRCPAAGRRAGAAGLEPISDDQVRRGTAVDAPRASSRSKRFTIWAIPNFSPPPCCRRSSSPPKQSGASAGRLPIRSRLQDERRPIRPRPAAPVAGDGDAGPAIPAVGVDPGGAGERPDRGAGARADGAFSTSNGDSWPSAARRNLDALQRRVRCLAENRRAALPARRSATWAACGSASKPRPTRFSFATIGRSLPADSGPSRSCCGRCCGIFRRLAGWPARSGKPCSILTSCTRAGGRRSIWPLSPEPSRYLTAIASDCRGANYVADSGRQWYEIWVPHHPSALVAAQDRVSRHCGGAAVFSRSFRSGGEWRLLLDHASRRVQAEIGCC